MAFMVRITDEETGEFSEVGLERDDLMVLRAGLYYAGDAVPGPRFERVAQVIEGIDRLV